MFDKYGFYYLKEIGLQNYKLNIGASIDLSIKKNEYVVFHKRRFSKKNTNELQKGMALVCKTNDFNFKFDKNFFVYGLTYYQRDGKNAFIKGGDLEELELYKDLYQNFQLDLKLRKYLKIEGKYKTIDEIRNCIKNANLDQAISFLFALATIYGDWNIIEDEEDIYLGNILLKFPFDSSLGEYQDIIFYLEDILIKNGIYNKLTLTKKQEFIWNIYDYDILNIFGKAIVEEKIKDFFQVDESIKPLFSKKINNLKKQLDTDLRIKIDNFKLVEVEGVSLDF